MRIKSFKTSKYKNLHNIDIKFDADVITLLVGQNGLGKSNLIEILTLIFRNLYTIKEKKNFIESAIQSELSDYIIEYECNGIQLKIDYHDDKLEIYLKNAEDTYETISFAEFARNSEFFLPNRIMGYYSGENKRLEKILNEYTSKEKRKQQNAYKKGSVSKRLRNIFFSENRHSQLILFTLIFYWDHPIFGKAIDHLLTNILYIDEMTGFDIKFKSPQFAKLNDLKERHATLQDYEGEILQ